MKRPISFFTETVLFLTGCFLIRNQLALHSYGKATILITIISVELGIVLINAIGLCIDLSIYRKSTYNPDYRSKYSDRTFRMMTDLLIPLTVFTLDFVCLQFITKVTMSSLLFICLTGVLSILHVMICFLLDLTVDMDIYLYAHPEVEDDDLFEEVPRLFSGSSSGKNTDEEDDKTKQSIRRLFENTSKALLGANTQIVQAKAAINNAEFSMDYFMFPISIYSKNWKNIEDVISVLLDRYEKLLITIAPKDYKSMHKTGPIFDSTDDIISSTHKLDIYYCVFYMFTENWERLKERLTQLVNDTKQNAKYMLACDDPEKYYEIYKTSEYYDVFYSYWEPLCWLGNESLPNTNSVKLFIDALEQYIWFLYDYQADECHKELKWKMITNSEEMLRYHCKRIVEQIEFESNNLSIEKPDFCEAAEIYNKKISVSLERQNESLSTDKKTTS